MQESMYDKDPAVLKTKLENGALYPNPESFDEFHLPIPSDNQLKEQISLNGRELPLDNPKSADIPGLIDQLCQSAHHYIRTASYSMGLKAQQMALKLSYRHFGYGSDNYIEVLFWVALYYHKLLRYNPAEKLYLLVLRNRQEALGKRNPRLSPYVNNLGRFYKDTERYKPAEKLLLQSLQFEQEMTPNSTNVADRLNNLASLYTKQGKYSLALDYSHKALAIFSTSNHHHRDEHVALMQNNMGALYTKLGNLNQAEIMLEAALDYRLETCQPKSLELAGVYINYYQLAFARHDYDSALDYARRCLRCAFFAYGMNNLLYAQALMAIGDVYCHIDCFDKALLCWNQAHSSLEGVVSSKHPTRIKLLGRLRLV